MVVVEARLFCGQVQFLQAPPAFGAMTSLCRSCCAGALPGRTTGLLCLFLWISGHLFGNYPQVFRRALAVSAKKPCRRPDEAIQGPKTGQGHHRAIRKPTAGGSSAAWVSAAKVAFGTAKRPPAPSAPPPEHRHCRPPTRSRSTTGLGTGRLGFRLFF